MADKNYISCTKSQSMTTTENEKTKSMKNMKSSQFVGLLNPSIILPSEPVGNALEIIQEKGLEEELKKVKLVRSFSN